MLDKTRIVRPEADRLHPDSLRLEGTIMALRPFMTEKAASETETVLRRMFERARRWNNDPSGT